MRRHVRFLFSTSKTSTRLYRLASTSPDLSLPTFRTNVARMTSVFSVCTTTSVDIDRAPRQKEDESRQRFLFIWARSLLSFPFTSRGSLRYIVFPAARASAVPYAHFRDHVPSLPAAPVTAAD